MLITKDNHVFIMDKTNKPSYQTQVPCQLTFETLDCFSEQLKSATDTLETLNFDKVNPATGPVYRNNVNAGDVIAINISDIKLKSPGIMIAAPGAGVLDSLVN